MINEGVDLNGALAGLVLYLVADNRQRIFQMAARNQVRVVGNLKERVRPDLKVRVSFKLL